MSSKKDALQGRLSPYLLQPLHPLWRYLASHLSEQATRLPFVVLIMAIFFLFQPAAFWLPSPGGFLLAVVAHPPGFPAALPVSDRDHHALLLDERAAALERLLLIPYLFLSGLWRPWRLSRRGCVPSPCSPLSRRCCRFRPSCSPVNRWIWPVA